MQQVTDLAKKVEKALTKLDIESAKARLIEYESLMSAPDFWSNSDKAQKISKDHAVLGSRVNPWIKLNEDLNDLSELSELGEDVTSQLEVLENLYSKLEVDLRFDGQYDTNDVILTIQSGAGGTDAQDWAETLQRMYLKWVEKADLKSIVLTETPGEIAGIKNATIEISGDPYTYGKLKNEHGVHRLVRISPFNSGGTRETSFAMVDVLPKIDEPEDVDIDDKDLKIDTFRAGGNGGQSVNTTDSAVRITHEPTGVTVSMQNEKSQLQNKAAAMKILASRLTKLKEEQHQEKISELKGPNQDAAWGNQIRNYVMHPYKLVKNTDGSFESSDIDGILGGDLDQVINKQ